MDIVFHEQSGTFHLYNDSLSYIMVILRNGHLGQLYCGDIPCTYYESRLYLLTAES